jgi:hypothetical protein
MVWSARPVRVRRPRSWSGAGNHGPGVWSRSARWTVQRGGWPARWRAVPARRDQLIELGSQQIRIITDQIHELGPRDQRQPGRDVRRDLPRDPGANEGRTRWRTQPRCPILVAVRPGLGSRPGSGVPDSGEATGRRPNTPRPPAGRGGRGTGSGVDLLLSGVGAGDSDLAGLGPLRDRDPQRQHTGVVAGLDPVGVEGLAEEQLA